MAQDGYAGFESLEEAIALPKRVDVKGDAVVTARNIGISFGDE